MRHCFNSAIHACPWGSAPRSSTSPTAQNFHLPSTACPAVPHSRHRKTSSGKGLSTHLECDLAFLRALLLGCARPRPPTAGSATSAPRGAASASMPRPPLPGSAPAAPRSSSGDRPPSLGGKPPCSPLPPAVDPFSISSLALLPRAPARSPSVGRGQSEEATQSGLPPLSPRVVFLRSSSSF